jgi:Holliday junction resolvase-like predicted endonuclease
MNNEIFKSYHVGVAAEAYVAGMFARLGYDVSVQYGANQPEYDLIVAKEDKLLKISVKGSKDGAWGLLAKYKNVDTSYHEAANQWLEKHNKRTVMCFVQFENVLFNEMPRIYLATPLEVAQRLKDSSKSSGATILYESKTWTSRAFGYGTMDKIPDEWIFTRERIEELIQIID